MTAVGHADGPRGRRAGARARVRALGLAVLVLVAGCSSTTAGTSAAGGGPTTSPALAAFNACNFTDGQVTGLGLDTTTKENADVGNGNLATGCSWINTAQTSVVSITMGSQTVADLAARTDFHTLATSSLGGRDSVRFATGDPNSCYVAVASHDATSPAVVVHASLKFDSIGKVDPCPLATDVTTKLVPLLP